MRSILEETDATFVFVNGRNVIGFLSTRSVQGQMVVVPLIKQYHGIWTEDFYRNLRGFVFGTLNLHMSSIGGHQLRSSLGVPLGDDPNFETTEEVEQWARENMIVPTPIIDLELYHLTDTLVPLLWDLPEFLAMVESL